MNDLVIVWQANWLKSKMKVINAVKGVLNIDIKYGQIDDGLNTFVFLAILLYGLSLIGKNLYTK